ncbi:MAG TPA: glycerate kinase [Longimicrobiales bacterium]
MIIIAPTAYKGTIAASAAARAMAAGVRSFSDEPLLIQPVSDGGPGLLDAFEQRGGELHRVVVRGPLGDDVTARILVQNGSAIVESADACGLHLVPPQRRDPAQLDTFGVGQLLRAAAGLGVERVVVGLGGSATVDGGVGMAAALEGTPIARPVIALADVQTQLRDAARIFGPQKGATPTQVQMLEAALAKLLEITGVPDFAGAGAAGGLAYGLRAFVNAEVVSGSEWVLRETGLEQQIPSARALITGEGSYDSQSFLGKITGALVAAARTHRVPVLVIAGRCDHTDDYALAIERPGATLTEDDLAQLVRQHLPRIV